MKARPNNMKRSGESGNVFFIIMLGVVLFAALMFTFSRSARQGGENIGEKQAELAATSILAYAQSVERAVDRIRRAGFSEADVSFENASVGGYVNNNCLGNDECKVFKPAGGSISYMPPPTEWLDPNESGSLAFGPWVFSGNVCVIDIPTVNGDTICHANGIDDEDLVLFLPYVRKEVCLRINEKLGIPNTGNVPPLDGGTAVHPTFSKFTGSFAAGYSHGIAGSAINGRYTGCVYNNFTNDYHFHHVLIAR